MENVVSYPIFGFISYSRKDKRVADWLHSKLEHYVYPKDMVGEHQRPGDDKYLRPIFIDTQNLQVEERPFTEKIQESLRLSKFLFVICSKNSSKSPFVEMEIKYFLQTHNNNYSLIVPLFIDEVNDAVPSPFEGTSIMDRHFPIFNSLLGQGSEANEYCFMQIVSYILGIDFSSIFNRYEQEERKIRRKKTRMLVYLIFVLILLVIGLCAGILSQLKSIEKNRALIQFERDVFPQAVVYGYEENFLRPAINYLKQQNDDFKINVILPLTERELKRHQDRVLDAEVVLRRLVCADSINNVTLPTTMRRGTKIMILNKGGQSINGQYLDFATTTSSFIKVAEYKRKHEEYSDMTLDEIIEGYTHSFIRQTKQLLERDSIYVSFYTSVEELAGDLQK